MSLLFPFATGSGYSPVVHSITRRRLGLAVCHLEWHAPPETPAAHEAGSDQSRTPLTAGLPGGAESKEKVEPNGVDTAIGTAFAVQRGRQRARGAPLAVTKARAAAYQPAHSRIIRFVFPLPEEPTSTEWRIRAGAGRVWTGAARGSAPAAAVGRAGRARPCQR